MAQNPIVTIEMENGDIIKAELYPEIAPNTVNNFISLVNKGFYDGVIFHRVIRGFMIQGGDPEGTGIQHPRRILQQWFHKQPETYTGCSFHGTYYDAKLRRKPVLHHACSCSAS